MPRDSERFGLPVFQAAGFKTEVWDLSPMLKLDAEDAETLPSKHVPSMATFRCKLAALPRTRTLVLSFLSYGMKTWPYFRALSRAQVPYAVFWSAFVTNQNRQESLWTRLRRLRLRPLVEHAFSLIKPSLLGIAPPRLLFAAGGSNTLQVLGQTDGRTEVVRTHMHDYDIYLECRGHSTGFDRQTAVFIDDYLPFHPDFHRHGVPPFVSPEEYFPALNSFFDTLEKQRGLQVVIAAHPRSCDGYEKTFQGRPLIKGRTAALVRDANLVLTHASTATSFALLFLKPLFFLTSDAMNRSTLGGEIRSFAEELGQPLCNIDHINPNEIGKMDIKASEPSYTRFIERNLKAKGTADKPCWQLLVDRIKG